MELFSLARWGYILIGILIIGAVVVYVSRQYIIHIETERFICSPHQTDDMKRRLSPVSGMITDVVHPISQLSARQITQALTPLGPTYYNDTQNYDWEPMTYTVEKGLSGSPIQWSRIEDMFQQVALRIKTHIERVLVERIQQLNCEKTPAMYTLEWTDWRIKKIRKTPQGTLVIHGQIIYTITDITIIIDVWIHTADVSIRAVQLEGFLYTLNYQNDNTNTMVRDSQPVELNYSNPIRSGYHGDKGYLYGSNEPQSWMSEEEINAMLEKRKQDEFNTMMCYGKRAMTQAECEAGTDASGAIMGRGVWDRPCLNDYECPFFQANKNYPNTFGGCKADGRCQLPVGLTHASPRTATESAESAICYGCVAGSTKCCIQQSQKTHPAYGVLPSADYKFEGDEALRKKYSKSLTVLSDS